MSLVSNLLVVKQLFDIQNAVVQHGDILRPVDNAPRLTQKTALASDSLAFPPRSVFRRQTERTRPKSLRNSLFFVSEKHPISRFHAFSNPAVQPPVYATGAIATERNLATLNQPNQRPKPGKWCWS